MPTAHLFFLGLFHNINEGRGEELYNNVGLQYGQWTSCEAYKLDQGHVRGSSARVWRPGYVSYTSPKFRLSAAVECALSEKQRNKCQPIYLDFLWLLFPMKLTIKDFC